MVLSEDKQIYVSTAGEQGLKDYNAALASYSTYTRQDGNTSSRVGYDRADYNAQRPCEGIPERHDQIMIESERLYDSIGLVKNMIDLMTDFTIQGLRVVHPQRGVEKFYQHWFERINGYDRSERFCNGLYKFGNVIIKRRWAILSKKVQRDLQRAKAGEIEFEKMKAPTRRIPSRYIFLNPCNIEIIGGDVARFVGGRVLNYGLKIPFTIRNQMTSEDPIIKAMVEKIPEDMKQALNPKANNIIPLDPENTIVYHYKKDDWNPWAKPIMYGVFTDIRVLEKLKLTDLTALDGAVDRLRIFKLGDLEQHLMPAEDAFTILSNMLKVNQGAGTRDIIWGPDLQLLESNTDLSKFLGEEKYRPTMNAIYGGLGIPPSLTGTNEIGGTTNNLVSLRSLIKRLDYVRNKLIDFWTREFELVRQSRGFQRAAVLEFDQNNLGDEEAEKKLFIELADRDIVPYEFVQKKFGLDAEVQSSKVEHEWKERKRKARVGKAGPFHSTGLDSDIKKSLIDRNQVTPSEVGVELEERKSGETVNLKPVVPPQVGTPGGAKKAKTPTRKGGRPNSAKDAKPRKKRRFVPVTKAAEFWATEAQAKIAEIANPIILGKLDKKNMRSLTAQETEASEKIKFSILFNLEPNSLINEKIVLKAATMPFPAKQYSFAKRYQEKVSESLGRDLTLAEKHEIEVEVYLNDKV